MSGDRELKNVCFEALALLSFTCLLLYIRREKARESALIGKLAFCHRAANSKYKITLKCHLALVIIGFAAYCCVQNNKSLNFFVTGTGVLLRIHCIIK